MKFIDLHKCIQGEGKYSGKPYILARVTGCNLRCTWCDTPYSSFSPEKGKYKIEDLFQLRDTTEIKDLLLTGGEPFLFQDAFYKIFSEEWNSICIETNASIKKKKDIDISKCFLSMSPKLSGSGVRCISLSTIEEYIYECEDYQLKFVISDMERDLTELKLLVQALRIPNEKVYLMPNAVNLEQLNLNCRQVFDIALENRYNYSDRLHIRAYNNERAN